ncbi:MAG: PD40 domain-containing protein [Flavobacteriia bacterium]|nr:PD40 domain-containing protein [Flavobacteriia bacterium]
MTKYISLLFCLLFYTLSFAQNPEPEIKSKADKAFKKEDFVEASKLYAQLLTFNQTDPFYNYRYGICLMYNSRKKNESIKHLTFASKSEGFDNEVFFYLGKAYHLDYRFKEAINYYNLYKTKAGTKINMELDVDRNIVMSENGIRLLSSSNEVIVLDKQEIEIPSFFRIYDLKDIGGNIIVTAQFQSKIDKKRNHTPLIHFPSNPKRIFYSSYGEEENSGKDIYMRQRLPDGTWSLPQKIQGNVNTPSDEDFPYLSPKGNYLYFSSKGHNSMGGYDIFRSRYNAETNEFEAPENLDFPISSPDNDLFYVVDSLEENANFASARQSLDGKMHVYQIKVEKIPIQFVVVKSFFSSTINPNNKKVSVEVLDYSNGKKIGTFNSSTKGAVLLTFPKGGKYEYVVSVDGSSKSFRHLITIPFLKNFRPLKQKIIHENDANNQETVTIQNFFDEDLDDEYEVIREIAMMRGELNPNSDQYDLDKISKKADNSEIYSKLGMAKLNDTEVIKRLEELVETQEKRNEDLEKVKETSLSQSMENIKSLNVLQEDLKKTVSIANSKSGDDRRESFQNAGLIVNELNFLEDYSERLIKTADSLNEIIDKNKIEISKYKNIVNELDKLLKSGDMSAFISKLNNDLSSLQQLQKENPEFILPSLYTQIMAQHEEMNAIEEKIFEIKAKNFTFQSEIEKLKIEEENASGNNKASIQKKIDEKKNIQTTLDNEIKALQLKLIKSNDQLLKLESSLAYFQDILNSTPPHSDVNSSRASKALKELDNDNTRNLKTYVEQQLKELGVDMRALSSESEKKKIERYNNQKSLARNLNSTNEDLLADNTTTNNDTSNELAPTENKQNINSNENQNNSNNKNHEVSGKANNNLNSDSNQKSNSENGKNLTDKDTNEKKESSSSNEKPNTESKNNSTEFNKNKENKISNENQANSNNNNESVNSNNKSNNDSNQKSNAENNINQSIKNTNEKKEGSSSNSNENQNTESKNNSTEKNKNEDLTKNNNSNENLSTQNNISNSTKLSSEIDTNLIKKMNNPQFIEEKLNTNVEKASLNKTFLDSNPNLTDDQKEKAKIRQDKKILLSIDSDIQRLKIVTSNNPDNQDAKQSLTLLEEKKKSLENQILEKEKELETKFPEIAKTTAWNEEQLIEMTNPDLAKEIGTINNNRTFSDYTKSKLLIDKNQELLNELSLDKEVLKKDLSKNLNNTEAKNEINMMDALLRNTEKKKEESERFVSNYKIKETLKNLGSDEEKLLNAELLKLNPVVLKARKELLKDNLAFASMPVNSLNDINNQTSILSGYYNALSDRIYELEKKQSTNKKDTSLVSEIKLLNQELEMTRKKLDENELKSDELDKQMLAENYVTLNNEISYLKQEDNELKLKINDPNTPKKEKKELMEKRAETLGKQAETYEKVNALQTVILSKYPPNKIRNKKMSKEPQNILDSLAYSRFKLNEAEIKEGLVAYKEQKSPSKKIKILPELIEKQEENSIIAQRLLYNSQLKKHLRQVTSYTTDMYALESKQSIQKSVIKLKNAKDDAEKSLEKEKLALTKAKKKKKDLHIKKISNIKKEIDNIELIEKNLELELLKRESFEKEIKKELPKKQVIDIADENKMRSNAQYQTAKELYIKKKLALEGMKLIFDELDEGKNRYNVAVVDYANDPNRKNKQYAGQTFENLKSNFKQFSELQNKYQEISKEYSSNTSDFHDLTKLEQLFEEDIEKQKREEELKNKNIVIEQVDMLAYEEKLSFENQIPNEGMYYQIMIDKSDKMLNIRLMDNFSDIRAIMKENGETEFYTSFVNSAVNAEKMLSDVQKLSYINANIVAYQNGKQIPFVEARMISDNEYYTQLALKESKAQKGKNKKGKTKAKAKTTKETNYSEDIVVQNKKEKNSNDFGSYNSAETNSNSNQSSINSQKNEKKEFQSSENLTNNSVKNENKNIENTTTNNLSNNPTNTQQNSSQKDKTNSEKTTEINNSDNNTISKEKSSTNNESTVVVDKNKTWNEVNTNSNNQNSYSSNKSTDKYENLKNAESIDNKKGLYFTVQIGAFWNKKYPSNLAGISPVYSKSFDGMIRYSTGIFHSLEEAIPAKQQMIANGVFDAFVTAYYDGKRITIAEAQRLLSEKGAGILENK